MVYCWLVFSWLRNVFLDKPDCEYTKMPGNGQRKVNPFWDNRRQIDGQFGKHRLRLHCSFKSKFLDLFLLEVWGTKVWHENDRMLFTRLRHENYTLFTLIALSCLPFKPFGDIGCIMTWNLTNQHMKTLKRFSVHTE